MRNSLIPGGTIVLFTLDGSFYALDLSTVERIIRAVEITPLPKAPEIVLGVINMQGRILTVLDIRKRFRLPPHEISVDDRFIIALASKRQVALVVDSVTGIRELTENQIVNAGKTLPFAKYLKGVAKLEDGLVLIHDLGQFLSLGEEKKLNAALSGGRV